MAIDQEGGKVVIFGDGRFAELAWYVLTHDSEFEVAAFTVDGAFLSCNSKFGVPVIAFEDVESRFCPEDCRMLVALGYQRVNRLRAERFKEAKEKGYSFASYVSSRASIWEDLDLGENCMVYENAVIQPFAKIGDNSIIRSGAHVSHHVRIGKHCFLSAAAALGGSAEVGDYSFVGLNATIRDNVSVAPRCVIGAGAALMMDTKESGIYLGVPAKRQSK